MSGMLKVAENLEVFLTQMWRMDDREPSSIEDVTHACVSEM